MDHEMESFQKDLLASVRQMKAGKAARTTEVKLSAAAAAEAPGPKSVCLKVHLRSCWASACARCRIGSKVVGDLPVRHRPCCGLPAGTRKRCETSRPSDSQFHHRQRRLSDQRIGTTLPLRSLWIAVTDRFPVAAFWMYSLHQTIAGRRRSM